MKKTFPELPSWTFEVKEVSAGVYEVAGLDAGGQRVHGKGIDPDALLAECRRDAARLPVARR